MDETAVISGIDIDRTIGRFEEQEDRARARWRFPGTAEFRRLATEPVHRLAEYIPKRLGSARQDAINVLLDQLDEADLALVTLASVTDSVLREIWDPRMTEKIGQIVQGLAVNRLKLTQTEPVFQAGTPAVFQVGNRMLDFTLTCLPDWFELICNERGAKGIALKPEKEEWASHLCEQIMWANPVLVPALSAKPWVGWRDGGYQSELTRPAVAFVSGAAAYNKEIKRAVQAGFDNGTIRPHADAVSTLQDVPLRINERILAAVKEYYPALLEEKFRKKEIALKQKRRQLAASTSIDRQQADGWLKQMDWVHRQIERLPDEYGQAQKMLKTELDLAEFLHFQTSPFKVPLQCDFRGRLNPVPHFHYQREDHIRSLFRFDRGLPIGDGEKHLKDLVASHWGQKGTLHKRREWCERKMALIEATARLESKEWLSQKKPFALLAACMELSEARKARAQGADFITTLPIFFDGACNGLMHFCALTRTDPIGMMADYATATPSVDPYLKVAERVDDERDLVKLSVSTYPYGVSHLTMANQIEAKLEERGEQLPDDPREARKVVLEMTGEVRRAIEEIVPGARVTMKFLRKLAWVLAKKDKTLEWTTPSGFAWANRYDDYEIATIKSHLQGVRIRRKVAIGFKPTIKPHDARNACAPNFIHGLDAAHLARTVNACADVGITDLLTIHDCYATTAAQAEQMNRIIREQFVLMYLQHDPLTEIRDAAQRILPDAVLPPVPPKGNLDIRTFLNTPLSFAP